MEAESTSHTPDISLPTVGTEEWRDDTASDDSDKEGGQLR